MEGAMKEQYVNQGLKLCYRSSCIYGLQIGLADAQLYILPPHFTSVTSDSSDTYAFQSNDKEVTSLLL